MIKKNLFSINYLALLFLSLNNINAQQTITFPSKDKVIVTADYYEHSPYSSYIVMFHQAGYSRGEYKETAEKFKKLGYNCLAVDLRSGNEVNYIINKTALDAHEKGLTTTYFNSILDIQAAIEYACNKSRKPVIVVGSSYSASLCLLLARTNPQIKAVIAFSPGEYFGKENFIRDSISGLDMPIFAACTTDEYPFVKELLSKVNQNKLTLFKPSKGKGKHGSSALWQNNPSNNEYWLAIMLFFDQIKD